MLWYKDRQESPRNTLSATKVLGYMDTRSHRVPSRKERPRSDSSLVQCQWSGTGGWSKAEEGGRDETLLLLGKAWCLTPSQGWETEWAAMTAGPC